jgi:hypothetical protein
VRWAHDAPQGIDDAATTRGWEEIFDFLIRHLRDDLVDCGNDMLRRAARSGCLVLIKRLFRAAENDAELRQAMLRIDVVDDPLARRRGGGSSGFLGEHQSIGEAAYEGHADVVRFLCEQRRLKFLICSCPHLEYSEYGGLLTFRIYLCKQAVGVLEDGRPKEAFDRAAQKMLTAIRRLGEGSPDKLLASRRLGRSSEECQFSAERVFQFIGAIVYDMEWTSAEGESDFENAATLADATNTISPGFALQYSCWHFVRHMLLVDYGFSAPPLFQHWRSPRKVEDAIWTFERFCGFVSATAWRWRQGHGIPDQRAWDLIIDVLAGSITWQCPLWTWDAAIMFYYYYSRRKLVSPQERRSAPRNGGRDGRDTPGSFKR